MALDLRRAAAGRRRGELAAVAAPGHRPGAVAGEPPSPQVRRADRAPRRGRAIAGRAGRRPSPVPRVGADVDGDGRVYIDHARDIGAFNPCFPEYEIDGRRRHGRRDGRVPDRRTRARPGIVHGGFLAVFFDCVIQHHNCDVGVAGKTTDLELRYRRPTPLLTALDVRDRPHRRRRPHRVGRPAPASTTRCARGADAGRRRRPVAPSRRCRPGGRRR